MSRSSSLLFISLVLASHAWAQDEPSSRLPDLRDLAESATAAANANSYKAPDPVLTPIVDKQVACKYSKTDVPDNEIEGYRSKFRKIKGGQAVIDQEPGWNNARRCYYLVAKVLYKVQ
jgi:hypothetical protein